MATGVTDGRSARSARTKRAVVEALLALIEDGNLRPTAREVAARAGISLRSVYVHFADLEELFLRAAEVQVERVAEAAGRPPGPEGPLHERVRRYVGYRATVLETSGPVRRAAGLHEPFSPLLAELSDFSRRAARAELATAFAPELDALPPRVRARRLAALHALVDPGAYDVLRGADGLDEEATRAVLSDGIRTLLIGSADV